MPSVSFLGLKFGALASILAEGVVGAAIPFFFRTNQKILEVAQSFGAGVFTGVAFLHLLPDVAGELPELLGIEAPVDFLIILAVLLLLVIVEEVCMSFAQRKGIVVGHGGHDHGHDHGDHEHEHDHEHCEEASLLLESESEAPASTPKSQIAALVLLFALGLHCLFAGYALGMSTSLDNLYNLWLAIGAHKWAEILCASIMYINAKIPRNHTLLYLGILVMLTPIGMCLGFVTEAATGAESRAGQLAEAVANCCAAGSFIYVAVCEILIPSLKYHAHSNFWIRVAFVLVGVAIMFGVAMLE